MIRRARDDELPRLQDIERAAGAPFRDLGMAEIADDPPLPVAQLARYRAEGAAWVAVDAADRPFGYLIGEVVDGSLHIEQVSVDPRYARQGHGRRLIEHAAGYAREHHLTALTLTTFAEVPWNAPYYARCGSRVVAAGDLTPQLRRIRQREAEHGLDRWPRVVMRRDL
jgi:ribosomal protein S18 acetylase RimI-like enzyme